jgi:Rieske Fe-S protein
MQLVYKSGKFLFFFFILFSITNSCDKIQDSQVPNVPFRSPEFNLITSGLGNTGTYFIPGLGYGGVIVFCAWPSEEYYAFDATCTHEINNNYLVLKDQKFDIRLYPCPLNSFILTCTGCGSQFNVGDGSAYPIKGPAVAPLKPYRTSIIRNSLVIYNY